MMTYSSKFGGKFYKVNNRVQPSGKATDFDSVRQSNLCEGSNPSTLTKGSRSAGQLRKGWQLWWAVAGRRY